MTDDHQLEKLQAQKLPAKKEPDSLVRYKTHSPYSGFRGDHDVELVVGSIFGIRGWNLDSLGRLIPVNAQEVPFQPGVNHATCHNITGRDKSVRRHNMFDCSCGYYAYFSDDADDATHGEITGIVEATGVVVVGTEGFRAEKAELKALVMPNITSPAVLQPPAHFRRSNSGRGAAAVEPFGWRAYRWIMKWFLPSFDTIKNSKYLGKAPVSAFIAMLIACIASASGAIAVTALGMPGLVITAAWVFVALMIHAVIFTGFFLTWVDGPYTAEYRSSPSGLSKVASFTRRSPYTVRITSIDFESPENLGDPNDPESPARMKILYPDVKIYSSRRAAMAAHPLTKVSDFGPAKRDELPSPANTDDFWSMSV